MGIAHWDDVEGHRHAQGEIDATWQRLGRAAGTKDVGLNRVRVAPGKLPTPPHLHGASEEVFYVLAGSGLAWQDGEVHEVRARDCVIHRADELEHTFVAGQDGLDYLAFGTNWPWVEGRTRDPWDHEAGGAPLAYGEPAERPPNILNVDEVELERYGSMNSAPLATDERSDQAGFHWERLDAGGRGSPPHCHSEEEEIFVILDGDGTLELWPSPLSAARGVEREDVPLRPGLVIARPPGSRVGHAFQAGPSGLAMLIYGTRKPNDLAWFPRSNKIFWRGLGVIGRIESLAYDDGEPD